MAAAAIWKLQRELQVDHGKINKIRRVGYSTQALVLGGALPSRVVSYWDFDFGGVRSSSEWDEWSVHGICALLFFILFYFVFVHPWSAQQWIRGPSPYQRLILWKSIQNHTEEGNNNESQNKDGNKEKKAKHQTAMDRSPKGSSHWLGNDWLLAADRKEDDI